MPLRQRQKGKKMLYAALINLVLLLHIDINVEKLINTRRVTTFALDASRGLNH